MIKKKGRKRKLEPKEMRNSVNDPLLSWLCSIKEELDELHSSNSHKSRETLDSLLEKCVKKFKDDDWCRNDSRFLKIWLLYADSIQDFDTVYKIMEEEQLFLLSALLYTTYAVFLEVKGKLVDADRVYRMGISRNAEPIEALKTDHGEFLKRMSNIMNGTLSNKMRSSLLMDHQCSESIEAAYDEPMEESSKKRGGENTKFGSKDSVKTINLNKVQGKKAQIVHSSCYKIAMKFQKLQELHLRGDNEGQTCNGESYLLASGVSKKLDDFGDLADFIVCKKGKNQAKWLEDREKFRGWVNARKGAQMKEKRKKAWKHF